MNKGCHLSPPPVHIIPGVLANTVRQEKEIRGVPIGKEVLILSLMANDVIFYVKNPKGSTTTTTKNCPGINK